MKEISKKLREMSPVAREILRSGLIVANVLMFGSLLLLWFAGPETGSTYELHAMSQTMRDTCVGVLFVVVFGSAFIEEQSKKTTKE